MGDASDDYAADDMFRLGMEDAELDNERKRPLLAKTVWVTKDGQRIPIKELADGHLVNIIKFLLRKAEVERRRIDEERAEIIDVAGPESVGADLTEGSAEEYLERYMPTWDALLTEAMKRKLVTRDGFGDLVFP